MIYAAIHLVWAMMKHKQYATQTAMFCLKKQMFIEPHHKNNHFWT